MRVRFAGLTAVDGRLVCLIEAPTMGYVRDLVALAFLPAHRLREISGVDLPCRQDPVGDLGSGVQSELVEDVVDVGLDGPLGQE